jgi:large subunit ribosomal protein L13
MVAVKSKKTYVAKPKDLNPQWHLFDASKQPLGRMAVQIAKVLQGKHRSIYTPNINTGDFVIVVNASKVFLTGKKMVQRKHYFHSGYPGGMREFTTEELLDRNPNKVIELAVRGMLPKNTLAKQMLKRLKIYPGIGNPHAAQIAGYGTVEAKELNETLK